MALLNSGHGDIVNY